MCTELKTLGTAALLERLECLCASLEKVRDLMVVCASAAEGGDQASLGRLLHQSGARPLGLALTQLSTVIVQLRDGKAMQD